jgi:hypothetical protein
MKKSTLLMGILAGLGSRLSSAVSGLTSLAANTFSRQQFRSPTSSHPSRYRSRQSKRRTYTGGYGKAIMASFDRKGINWSSKPNYIRKAASR